MPERLRDALSELAAVLLGVAAFLVFAGWWVLIPTNVAWLDVADRAMHTLGWMFYRDAPWGFPPGSSPRLGIELANSIALVDGLPIVAIPLKLLSAWLPRPFQYWGWWWLACFALQSLFAFRLARELGASRAVALCAAGFALITPAFLARLTLHMALAGHWLLLAAMWLYAKRTPPRAWAWPLLVLLTASIHAYLLAMVGAVWIAAYVQRLWLGRLRPAGAVIEPAAITVLMPVLLYLAGFAFAAGSPGIEGFGYYRLNLLGPILDYGMWSAILPSLPHGYYDYEGLSFPGIGIFAALALAIVTGAVARLGRLVTPRWLPLLVLVFCAWLFALSNRIGFLDLEARPIPLPGVLMALGDAFRSSGRFVWPLLYLVTIGAVVLVGRRLGSRWAVPLLVVAFAVQVVDSRVGWSSFRATIPPPAGSWPTPLVSPVWDRAAAAGYNRLRAVPPRYRAKDWKALETYAYDHGMDVDAVYLGRVDERALAALQATEDQVVASGAFEPHTLYVLNLAYARLVAPHVQPGDLFAVVDNRILFARGGAKLVDGLAIPPHGAAEARSWVPSDIAARTGL